MTLQKKMLIVLLATSFLFCKKEKELVIPAPDSCEGFVIEDAPLKSKWTLTMFSNGEEHPIVYGNQIIFNKCCGNHTFDLIGCNKVTGVQEWVEVLPSPFSPGFVKLQGNQMYWVNVSTKQLVSFDLDNHSYKILWKAEGDIFDISPQFELIKGGALIEIVYNNNTPPGFRKDVVLEKIDFQNDTSTELYRVNRYYDNDNNDGFLRIQHTLNAKGDTLAVFLQSGEFYSSVMDSSSVIAVNINNKEVEQILHVPGKFIRNFNPLIVKDGQVWVSTSVNYISSTIFNFNLENGVKNWEKKNNTFLYGFELIGDKIIAIDGFATYAYQAATGSKIWQNGGRLKKRPRAFPGFAYDGRFFIDRNFRLLQLDLETGCILKNQAIEFASEPDWVVYLKKDPVLNLLHIGLHKHKIAVQL